MNRIKTFRWFLEEEEENERLARYRRNNSFAFVDSCTSGIFERPERYEIIRGSLIDKPTIREACQFEKIHEKDEKRLIPKAKDSGVFRKTFTCTK